MRGSDLNYALKRFESVLAGSRAECVRHDYYVPPSLARRLKSGRAAKRVQREAAQRAKFLIRFAAREAAA